MTIKTKSPDQHFIGMKFPRHVKSKPAMAGNTLKIDTLDNLWRGKKTWHDADQIIVHAPFQAVVNYVELEKAGKRVNWTHSKEYRDMWTEIMAIYTYWKNDRKIMDREYYRELHNWGKTFKNKHIPEYKEDGKTIKWYRWDKIIKNKKEHDRLWKLIHKLEDRNIRTEEEMLHRIIKIRRYLWV